MLDKLQKFNQTSLLQFLITLFPIIAKDNICQSRQFQVSICAAELWNFLPFFCTWLHLFQVSCLFRNLANPFYCICLIIYISWLFNEHKNVTHTLWLANLIFIIVLLGKRCRSDGKVSTSCYKPFKWSSICPTCDLYG